MLKVFKCYFMLKVFKCYFMLKVFKCYFMLKVFKCYFMLKVFKCYFMFKSCNVRMNNSVTPLYTTVENIEAKEKMPFVEQFLHFSQCFEEYSIITLSLQNYASGWGYLLNHLNGRTDGQTVQGDLF